MTEDEYLDLLENDPSKLVDWAYSNRFVFHPVGGEVDAFDDDLLREFMQKLLAHFSLTEAQAIELMENEDDTESDVLDLLNDLNIKAVQTGEGTASLQMDWAGADPWTTVEWLGTLGFDITFYGYSGGAEGQVGVHFIP